MKNFEEKISLDKLVNRWTVLGDEKRTEEQLELMTSDVNYQVYFGDQMVVETVGREKLIQEFKTHATEVNRYFSLDGQHIVDFNRAGATGTLYSQMKMVRVNSEGQEVLTDYSVKYQDTYVKVNKSWRISQRVAYYVIVNSKALSTD
ncbi:nuclear transport factor 2 family protein [Lactiplantibacillus pingfangensis]|uniref:nuclear transport factor 2 family protein n=1 Tax=Lactiplantibacillus pingfangensis TaxID=2559915 RepID=UPI0010F55EDF|nr:nuclear transport factor 2 family protein [Lactiplantibacillus pingfangensis]